MRLVLLKHPSTNSQYPEKNQYSTPKENWPAWAKGIASQRIEGEIGVGDTAHRLIHSPGAGLLADGMVMGLALFGRKCGCAKRKEAWNKRYSYRQHTFSTNGNTEHPTLNVQHP
jgi:hypothetical protein